MGTSGFALLCLVILLFGPRQLLAQENAVVLLEPNMLVLDKGQRSSVLLRVENAANVYGVQIDISFDAGKIKVLDEDETKSGVQVLSGDFLTLDKGFVAANEANNEIGQLTYALTLLAPAEPASGSGTLLQFEVEALESGSIDLRLGPVILASPEGAQLPVQLVSDVEDGRAIIVPVTAVTEGAPSTAPAGDDPPVKVSPTAEDIVTPPSSPDPTAATVPAEASPAGENRRLPTASATAALVASGDPATRSRSEQTSVSEADATEANHRPSEAAEQDLPVEIAAVPPSEKEDPVQIEAVPSPALTVIGQNRKLAENQAQVATPAPTAASEDNRERPYAAIGLILLIVALIAIWFIRRVLSAAK